MPPPCSCPEPVASATCAAPTASASSSAAPPSAEHFTDAKRLLEGVVTGPKGKPVANAVVYIENAPNVAGRGDRAVVDQRNMKFLPFVVAVAAGGAVTFANSDPFPHNVYIHNDGERYDSGMVSSNTSRRHVFKKPGAFKVLCNLHPTMLAYVVVSPSSYFGVTDYHGKFHIKDVPEGNWKVTTWAFNLAPDTQSVKVAGGDATFNPTLKAKSK